jgi:hypothetical protein
MHFWQLKTFWYETKVFSLGASAALNSSSQICMDDIECHSYDEISAAPPMQVANVDDSVKLVVEEMLRFKEEVRESSSLSLAGPSHSP